MLQQITSLPTIITSTTPRQFIPLFQPLPLRQYCDILYPSSHHYHFNNTATDYTSLPNHYHFDNTATDYIPLPTSTTSTTPRQITSLFPPPPLRQHRDRLYPSSHHYHFNNTATDYTPLPNHYNFNNIATDYTPLPTTNTSTTPRQIKHSSNHYEGRAKSSVTNRLL